MESSIYRPSESIQLQRAELSKAFSSLRRTRPRVPFWLLAAHRIPTLWTLYRGIQREAPSEEIKWRMRRFFEVNRSITSPSECRKKLLIAHKFLNTFTAARQGNEKTQRILLRYDRLIHAKRKKHEMESRILRELKWQYQLRHRPILTGALLRPSMYNKPLPRMKPQPVRLSMMIRRRRNVYERMSERLPVYMELLKDLDAEKKFEASLQQKLSDKEEGFNRIYESDDWGKLLKEKIKSTQSSLAAGYERAAMRYPKEMLDLIREARREKVRNRTREHERVRRGFVSKAVLRRSRKGPPAHILVKMTDWERRADQISRGVSEVGYVGMIKAQLGMKLKDPSRWKELEEGREEDRERLDGLYKQIIVENAARSSRNIESDSDDS